MNRRMPPQRFQKKNLKPKVLVMGHSWVKDIEEEHLRNPVSDCDLEFAYEEGVRISGLIDMIPRVMATYHTHILLFSVLPDALSLYSIDSQNPMTSQYKVLGPNKDFNPELFCKSNEYFHRTL
ncbi:hypothetical protein Avbf_01363 [Armadillidium vulgare]|nr:hypothetical protein Avbf_01363 [Armadillidium vulgare]